MYVNLNAIVGYQIQSTDGPAGKVDDIFIDDILWTVRHIAVADAGGVGTQPAEIDPGSYGDLVPDDKTLNVKLTHAEISGGPDVSSDPPVSMQTDDRGDHHLRSVHEIHGYRIEGLDGEAGKIDDFIVDDAEWKIHFIVVETGEWNDGRKIVIAPGLLSNLDHEARSAKLDLDLKKVADSPAYDPSQPILREENIHVKGHANV
jgi:hypothetical protein